MPMGYPMNDLQAVISRDVTIDIRSVVRKSKLRGWRFMAAPRYRKPSPHITMQKR